MRVSLLLTLAARIVSTNDVQDALCSESEAVQGSALLQVRGTTMKASTDINVTAAEEEEVDAEFRMIQKERTKQLLEKHHAEKREAFSQYKLTITENYGGRGCGGSSSCIQFAELNLYHGGEEINYEGASFEQGAGENSPGREQATNAFDNNARTKYLSRRGEDVKELTITLGSAQEVDDLSFTTGNDSPDRDPKRFKLEGSNDGSSWEMVIDKTGEDLPQTSGRRQETQLASGAAPPSAPAGGSGDGGSGGGGAPAGGLTCYERHSVPRCGACTSSEQCECQGPGNFCCPSMQKCRCGGGCGRSPEGFTELLPTC